MSLPPCFAEMIDDDDDADDYVHGDDDYVYQIFIHVPFSCSSIGRMLRILSSPGILLSPSIEASCLLPL